MAILHVTLLLFVYFFALKCNAQDVNIENVGITLSLQRSSTNLEITVKKGNEIKLKGQLGVGSTAVSSTPCVGVENCFLIGNSRLHINKYLDDAFTVYWISNDINEKFEDCFELGNSNWFGGPERFDQLWPIEKLTLDNFANVLQENQWGAVAEPYWLNSNGTYLFVDEKVPLFINQNTASSSKRVCFSAKLQNPYPKRNKVVLHYTIGVKNNPREAHLHAVTFFLGKPSGYPNYRIIERPIWSTWARYKRNVNDSIVLNFANEIVDNGYKIGQFEIDDDWEDCYGALTFRKSKFGNINTTVTKLKEMNFTVSLWVHPFININCDTYLNTARRYGFLVKNTLGSDLTQWWNSKKDEATYLDYTNPEVREWFIERLKALQHNHGIDSFKFDAGETSWAPQIPVLNGDSDTTPNNLASDYVRTCAKFGDLVEVRSGWKTQDLPIFVRMIDKDSTWGSNNGLYTLITTLLQMNLNGYTMVLPDMVGGNGYNGAPSAQLFIRWLQATVFMPSLQFSYVPWDYKDSEINVVDISKKMVDLHQNYAPEIKKAMENSVKNGHPVNAPIWWIDPTNNDAHNVDTEFLLGENILVAPVILENSNSRNVYLPNGTWIDGNNGSVYKGPTELKNYHAPIEVLPYFLRQERSSTNSAMVSWPLCFTIIILSVLRFLWVGI